MKTFPAALAGQRGEFVGLLAASVGINMWVLVFTISLRLLSTVGRRRQWRRDGWKLTAALLNLHKKRPVFVGKLFADGVIYVILQGLTIYCLTTTNISWYPFASSEVDSVLSTVVGLNAGQHALQVLVYIIWFKDIRHGWVFIVYHVTSAASLAVTLAYHMNVFLALVAVCTDVDGNFRNFQRIARESDMPRENVLYKTVIFVGTFCSVLTRLGFTAVGYVVAFRRQSVMVLDPVVLGFLCFNIIFFFVFGVWVLRTWVVSLLGCYIRQETEAKDVLRNQNLCMNNKVAFSKSRSLMFPNLHRDHLNKLSADKSEGKVQVDTAVISCANRSTSEINCYLEKYYANYQEVSTIGLRKASEI